MSDGMSSVAQSDSRGTAAPSADAVVAGFDVHLSAGAPGEISSPTGREFLNALGLPEDAHERIAIALLIIDDLDRHIHELERSLRRTARNQTGCQALMSQFGVGELIALTLLSELGDVTRMSSSRKAVRFAGLDIGVHRSDQTARVDKLTRQGSSPLRWALYEAAQSATRPRSPDYNDYHALRTRGLTHTRASLTIARRIARRSYHLLHNLGPSGLAPTAPINDEHALPASSISFCCTHPVETLTETERLDPPSGGERSTITSRPPTR